MTRKKMSAKIKIFFTWRCREKQLPFWLAEMGATSKALRAKLVLPFHSLTQV